MSALRIQKNQKTYVALVQIGAPEKKQKTKKRDNFTLRKQFVSLSVNLLFSVIVVSAHLYFVRVTGVAGRDGR